MFPVFDVLSSVHTRNNIERMLFNGKGTRPYRAYTINAYTDQIVRMEEVASRTGQPVAQVVRRLLDFALDALGEGAPFVPGEDNVEDLIT